MAARGGIGAELRALRLAAGLSMVEAARRAGVARVTIHRWESGDSAPERAGLDRLLAGLDADPRVRARLLTAGDPLRAAPQLASTPLGAPAHPGLILKALRARRGLSQADLARAVGTTQGTVARWEAGSRMPGGELLARALAALGASDAEAGWLREDAPDAYVPVRTVEEAQARARHLVGYEAPVAAIIALEREVWESAARDPRWEGTLAEVASVRSLAHRYASEPDAALDAASRALRLARASAEWNVTWAIDTISQVRLARGVSPCEVTRMWAEYMARKAPDAQTSMDFELWGAFEHQVDPKSAEFHLHRAMEGHAGEEPPDLDDCSNVNAAVYLCDFQETLAEWRFERDDLKGAFAALEGNGYHRREGHVRWSSTLGRCFSALRRAGERPTPALLASYERHRRRHGLTPYEKSWLSPFEAWLGLKPVPQAKQG